jgi:hypothetical protein
MPANDRDEFFLSSCKNVKAPDLWLYSSWNVD